MDGAPQTPQLSQAHAQWLAGRGVDPALAAAYGVHSRGPALAFVFQQRGAPKFAKCRAPEKKFFIEPSGQPLILWNEDSLRVPDAPSMTLVITEGEIDALSVLMTGAVYVVSVPNGAPAKAGAGKIDPDRDTAFSYLWKDGKLLPELARFKKIILAVDGDAAGNNLRAELAIRLDRTRCWQVAWPSGCKDANDVTQALGVEGLKRVLASSKPMVPNELVSYYDIPDLPEGDVFCSGWPELDPVIKISPPELIIVTGPPGSGKSQWVLNVGANLARDYGLRGAVIQLEDTPQKNREALVSFGIRFGCGVPQGDLSGDALRLRGFAERWVHQMFVTISPPEDDEITIDSLTNLVKEAATRHGCRWLILDPWNELEHIWGRGESEAVYTNAALKYIKKLARKYGLTIFIVAHPNAEGGKKTDIDKMNLYDVAGASAWNNKADQGFVVFRPSPKSSMCYVKKSKTKDVKRFGACATMKFDYHDGSSSYNFIEFHDEA